MLLCTYVYNYLFQRFLSFLLRVYTEVELLDQMKMPCLIFQETAMLFSTVATLFNILTAVQ